MSASLTPAGYRLGMWLASDATPFVTNEDFGGRWRPTAGVPGVGISGGPFGECWMPEVTPAAARAGLSVVGRGVTAQTVEFDAELAAVGVT
jgi:hypothetical protein